MPPATALNDDPNFERTCLRYGIPPLKGEKLAQGELTAWTPSLLSHYLDKIPRLPDVADTVKRPNFLQHQHWIKPPDGLIKKAAEEKLALCINASGEWRLMRSGYAAMSHVWEEGLYADPRNRGLPRSVIDQLFFKLRPLKVKWIWLDSLAIPGGGRDLTLEETFVKVKLINNMYSIYSNARLVVIMDALLLQLQTRNPIVVAVALLLSRWASRVWTFQEVKLASHAMILTKGGFIDLQRIATFLREKRDIDLARIAPIHKSLDRLLQSKSSPTSVLDVALSCAERETHDDIDYSRGVYACLGLTWDEKYTKEDGMQHIMKSFKEDAAQLLGMHGSPLLVEGYAWAPTSFRGLRGSFLPDVTWEQNGLRRPYYSYPVTLTGEKRPFPWSKSTRLYLQFHGLSEDITCECLLSRWETQDAIKGFKAAMLCKEAILLSQASLENVTLPLTYNPPLTVLLVKHGKAKNEAFIYMTAALLSLSKKVPARLDSWLINHESPRRKLNINGDLPNPARILSTLPHREETHIHRVIRLSGEAAIDRLISLDNLDVGDAAGWTPLHLASFLGRTEILHILLAAGASTQRVDNEAYMTPLHLAIVGQNADCTFALIQAKADVNKAANSSLTPLMLAVKGGNLSIVQMLINASAQTNTICDFKHQTALHMAVELRNTAALKLLLDAHDARKALYQKDHQGRSIGWLAASMQNYDATAVINRSTGLTGIFQNVSAEFVKILKEIFFSWLLGIFLAFSLDIAMLVRGNQQGIMLHPSLASLWGRFRGPAETLFWTYAIFHKSVERHRMWIGAAFKFFDLMSPVKCPQRMGLGEPLYCTMNNLYPNKTLNLLSGMLNGKAVSVIIWKILPSTISVLAVGGIHRYYRRSIYGRSVDEAVRALERGNEVFFGHLSVIIGGLQLTLLPLVVYYSSRFIGFLLGTPTSTIILHACLILGIGIATNFWFREQSLGEIHHRRLKIHSRPLLTIYMALISGIFFWTILIAAKFWWQGFSLAGELLLARMLGMGGMHVYITRLVSCMILGQIYYYSLWRWLARFEYNWEIVEKEKEIGWWTYFSKTTELGLRVYVLAAAFLTVVIRVWETVFLNIRFSPQQLSVQSI